MRGTGGTSGVVERDEQGGTLRRARRWCLSLVMALLVPWSVVMVTPSQAAAGDPITAFNTNVGSTLNATVGAVAEQSDGKILAAGYFTSPSPYLARFNADGTADTAFNTNVGTTLNNSA